MTRMPILRVSRRTVPNCKEAPYSPSPLPLSWIKIKNPSYTHGRERAEVVPGGSRKSMCGRITRTSPQEAIAEEFGVARFAKTDWHA
jgi:hypothetical protein